MTDGNEDYDDVQIHSEDGVLGLAKATGLPQKLVRHLALQKRLGDLFGPDGKLQSPEALRAQWLPQRGAWLAHLNVNVIDNDKPDAARRWVVLLNFDTKFEDEATALITKEIIERDITELLNQWGADSSNE